MNKLDFIKLFLIFLVLISCKNKASDAHKNLSFEGPKIIDLIGVPIQEIEIHSAGNVNLVVVDTFLVVQKMEEPILEIYSTNGYKLLAAVGKKGEGPNEFMYPNLINNTHIDPINNSPIVQVYDGVIHQFNLLKTINQEEGFQHIEKLPESKSAYISEVFFNDHEMAIANPQDDKGRLIFYRKRDSTTTYIPFIPKLDFEISGLERSLIYRTALALNKKKNQFVAGSYLLGRLDFFDFEGNVLKSTVFEETPELERQIKLLPPNPKMFIFEIETNQDLIYALNQNNQMMDPKLNEKFQNMELLVFDWDGVLLKKLVFPDKKKILSIAIDQIQGKLYGYSLEEEKFNIFVYHLEDKDYQ